MVSNATAQALVEVVGAATAAERMEIWRAAGRGLGRAEAEIEQQALDALRLLRAERASEQNAPAESAPASVSSLKPKLGVPVQPGDLAELGGPGSGHRGHRGRKGERGGSLPGAAVGAAPPPPTRAQRREPRNDQERAMWEMSRWQEGIEKAVARRGPRDGEKYYSMHGLLLAEGEFCEPAPHPRDVPNGRPRLCYMNAFKLADSDPERFALYEGRARIGKIDLDFEHAWVVDRRTGLVVDNTWDTPGAAYWGVEISLQKARRVMLETGVYGILPEAWRSDLPVRILAGDLAAED